MPPGIAGLRDHKPLSQENWRGLYTRGMPDSTPDAYLIGCKNAQFDEGEVLTRDGLTEYLHKTGIVRYFTYRRLNETPRLIMLDGSGNLLDSLAPGTPIWTDAAIVDFSMINYNNRAYITPHNRLHGIPGRNVLVYEGSGLARLAGGYPPQGVAIAAANSASSGSVETGMHLFGVCHVTKSGFITSPSESIPSVNAPGGHAVDISNMVLGSSAGAEVVARLILATKSIPVSQFVNNPYGYEFFFVPESCGGIINDATTTTATVSFFDSDLVESADYLLDNLNVIPAGLGITTYNGRLVVWAESGHEFTIRVSEPGQPEVFNAVGGFATIDPSDAGSGIKNCVEFRKSLIIWTSNRVYSTSDNGSDANTWTIPPALDVSCGTECFGIASTLSARGSNTDRLWVATLGGLVDFEGYIRRPEMSWNVEDTWRRINKAKFNLVQVVDDPVGHRLFISVPLDNSSVISHILYADYSSAFTVYGTIDEKAICWSIWEFPSNPVSISGEVDPVTFQPVFRLGLSGGNIYDMKENLTDDFGNAIESYIQTSLKNMVDGWQHHYAGIKLRIRGLGDLELTIQGEDDTASQMPPSILMLPKPGFESDRLFNFINEKCSIKLRVSEFGEYFILSRLDLYAKPLWLRRPG